MPNDSTQNRPGISVNGELVPQAEIRAMASSLRLEREAAGLEPTLEERSALIDEARTLLVDRMLLVQEARRLSFTPTSLEIDQALAESASRFDGVAGCRAGVDTPESRDDMSRRIMIDRLLERWRGSARRPRRTELQDYYRAHMEQFFQPEMVHASHIVRHFESASEFESVYAQVAELRERVANGENFGEVAAKHSDCPENHGDLGWFPRGVMVQAFDDVVFTAPCSELTPVFRTEFGFHFALVHARKEAGVRSFDEIRSQLEESLWLKKQDDEVGRALDGLRAKAIIEVER